MLSSRALFFSCTVAAMAAAMVCSSPAAIARPPYLKEFEAMYTKADGTDDEKAYAELVKKTKCNVCHKGQSKKERNAYGEALAKHLKKGDDKNIEKIRESLKTVADAHIDENDSASPTYGQLIGERKLPVAP